LITGGLLSINHILDFSLSNYHAFDFVQVDVGTRPMPEFNQRVEWIREELKRKRIQRRTLLPG
jgi:hypothetical protein